MKFNPLPFYPKDISSFLSADAIDVHYSKHHAGYYNKLIALMPEAIDMELEDVFLNYGGAVFNNAAQTWNHDFFWKSLSTQKKNIPNELQELLLLSFGSIEDFKAAFCESACNHFASGWAWIVVNTPLATEEKRLEIITTSNADNPLCYEQYPIITLDLWEHAYYLDYQNKRKDYVEQFINEYINWDFALERLYKSEI